MPSLIHFLSVLIPFFNEEDNVRPVIEEIADVVQRFGLSFEIVAVDDGSTDSTWERLVAVTAGRGSSPTIKMIKLKQNFGQTHALQVGRRHAQGDWILTMDGDGQNDPKSLGALLDKAREGYDVVSGWRKDRMDSMILRKLPSRTANWLLSKLTGLKLHDSGCSFKLYRAKALQTISLYADRHRFIPFLLHMRGFQVGEVIVNHRPRVRGKSKYGLSRTIKVFLDLIALTLFARFNEAPRNYFFIAAAPFFFGMGISLVLAISQLHGFSGAPGSVTYFGSTFLLLYGFLSLVTYGLLAEWIQQFERNAGHAAFG